MVGLHSAQKVVFPGRAHGAVGRRQLDALTSLVDEQRMRHRAVLVMLHHAPRRFDGSRDTRAHGSVAVEGSSYLRFGPVLRWFTGSIGLHHVHHLNPRIPNYRLEAARRAIPELKGVNPLSMADVRRTFTHVFWDEERGVMVPFADVGVAGAPDQR